MIINSTPQNEAVISNVGEIGEFRIRNSAKAFGILSSGLYANKIRAVIRELSCNALDSHVAAGKRDTPFDVHLPNQLEPWFSVRDYGLGLSHDQVTNIYTTYFESTKTATNELIGGLGLGSKSPFAYTDNFTVTASINGVKGIYTAFINEAGVPSIALMETSETTDPNGVEVKFSVNDRWDFTKFEQEARYVFKYFENRPVVSGVANFDFAERKYIEKDIVPGVHYTGSSSMALMGNVPYPIDVPNAQQNLGDLARLLGCGLELHFAIGEIDFQASREGLSYIPTTIDAIKRKLEALNAVLATKIAKEAEAITNLWERQVFLNTKFNQDLYSAAVTLYMHDTKFPLVDLDNLSGSRYFREKTFEFDVKVLEKKYNIKINAFTKAHYYNTCSNVKPYIEYDRTAKVAPGQQHPHKEVWQITASPTTMFVENDTSIGASERAKYHWKQKTMTRHTTDKVFVLSKADKKKDMKVSAFLKDLYNPPAAQVFKATALSQKARAGGGKAGGPVTLLKLEQRGGNNRHTYNDMVWRDAGDLNKLDKKAVHYYMPVIGFKTQSKFGANKQGSLAQEVDMKDLVDSLHRANVPGTVNLTVYGVRKADIDAVKAKKNWVNLEDHIAAQLAKLDDKFWMGLLHSELDSYSFLRYNSDIKKHIVAKDSLFLKVYAHFEDVKRVNSQVYCLNLLLKTFMPTVVNPLEDMKKKFVGECGAVYKKYPLLKHLSGGHNDVGAIAEYINLIDSKKVV